MNRIDCEECGGTGLVYWYIGEDLEEEEEECDICKGSGEVYSDETNDTSRNL